ncbi:MAG: ADP-ribosylglycohydrolase family protein [Archangium sp.]|nr:ADP-ribosylglycohydrolase family protein [Archangium sp.]
MAVKKKTQKKLTGSERMRLSLDGLSVGDAFGERFFGPPEAVVPAIRARKVPARAPWKWTDDTAMALSVVETLETHGKIDQRHLAKQFGARWAKEPARGYGTGAHQVLELLSRDADWEHSAKQLFNGQGSKGNGAAMRVAPLGAFFVDQPLSRVVEEAHAQAAVTHAHPDGQAGAVAVAVAAWCLSKPEPIALVWTHVLARTPHGPTRDALEKASHLGFDLSSEEVARRLGSGGKVLSEDTVPFSLWCALRHHDDYEEALWNTVAGLGDRDTTCAIVGGLVALNSKVPPKWLEAREPLSA